MDIWACEKEDLRVDSTNHTSLTMLALGAVEPNWLCICDADGVGEDLACSSQRGVCGHEAGEESVSLVGHYVLDGHAWVVECGLDDRVVLFENY
jgi:hypothetical protein